MNETAHVVLVGYGEVGTKSSSVRAKMESLLRTNLQAVLDDRSLSGHVDREWSRILVRDPDDPEAVAAACAEVPGVVWARPCIACAPDLDAIVSTCRDLTVDHPDGASFAVDADRIGSSEQHDFSSRDIEREAGSAVVDATGAPVDLDNPERTYRVECREDTAYLSARRFDGPGGLPLGTQGKTISLVSGGIDSPVATWELMRRGCEVVPVYIDLGDYGGADHRARAIETVRTIARRAPNANMRVHVVPAGDVVRRLMDTIEDTRMLSLRRVMLAIAAEVAADEHAHSIVTGESLGQKSSQTGGNLAVTGAAVDLPVHRPLLTRDKTDIVAEARELGTYDDSTLPVGCERVAPSYPETNASLAAVEAAEPADLFDLAAEAAHKRTVVSLDDDIK
ncbi:tRNA 4-thiouridine(8) synthase ThiI [Haloferax mediterranei ATCC 33500]|uniref:Probable tRNA sulfurtransferase n=1 Tax=Haloferax mediterranei (strain ATCC 33500 / DSM 1411 / JCM 8866 / NBRC 14739 / NCIMB 2177 / R-4) TaxID=523841 RepID=I3R5D7_HALMT|nr:tRNA uracil 4-sulfurtransferase ThiI [Haloferax mediterranei]AFK19447.1 thiamine biosynthesis protein ThiI [Haloferax mediterranei ATCC 33500]EMA04364.1 thiamine biosynthesis protein [Haloferax mediterranei ATCC 33500]MDX5989550.1 tRNA uracil 4-sulfurtransferase ThiI [Haloferax mediterranei ATCC 33500]QCQ75908.1 tRNA 4-thiouridine(8) synthase ThiI [Haloferax mediterranei ATCC 33500]